MYVFYSQIEVCKLKKSHQGICTVIEERAHIEEEYFLMSHLNFLLGCDFFFYGGVIIFKPTKFSKDFPQFLVP